MTILTVGAGEEYGRIADAVAASHDGDVIQVQAGVYLNDFATINTKITIEGVGGMAHLVATEEPPDGKAIITTNTDLTVQNLEFSGAAVSDGNGAGIRYQGGNLAVLNSYFFDNEDGILGSPPVAGTGSVTIRNSEFAHNGAGDGYTHNIYVGNVGSLVIDNSYFHDAVVGHEIKSRAYSTTITNSRIQDGPTGTASYSIDLPNGGATLIQNDVIQQGPDTQNPAIIAYGEEGSLNPNSTLTVQNDTILNDLVSGNASAVWNATGGTATVANNAIYGLPANQVAVGRASVTGTTYLTAEPALVTTSPWATPGGTTLATDTVTLHLSEDAYQGDAQFDVEVNGQIVGSTQSVTTLHSSGNSQAFTISGAWGAGPLTVGVTFLNDAFGPGGDRNLYVNSVDLNGTPNPAATAALYSPETADFVVYGPATPTPTPTPTPPATPTPPTSTATDTLVLNLSEDAWNGDAQFTATVDGVSLGIAQSVTASHILGQTQAFTFTGTWGAGPHTIGVSFTNDAYGGAGKDRNLYVASASLDGTSSPLTNVPLLSDSTATFQLNGVPGTNPVPVNPTPTSTPTPVPTSPVNAMATDTLVLTLSEDAWNGDAQFTTTVDGVSLGAARSVTASHIQGASQAFTFTGAWGAGPHTVGVSFINDAYGGAGLDRNLYVGSVAMDGTSSPVMNVPMFNDGTAAFQVTGSPATTTPTPTPPITTPPAPVPTPPATGTDTLVLNLSENAWNGDAQFTVSIDGAQVAAAQSVTADHNAGHTQAFTITGNYGAGPHTVGVSFINDAYGGGSMDRNLYVDAVTFDGTADPAGKANLFNNGTSDFAVVSTVTLPTPPVTQDTLGLNLSEDAYLGDAQFLVSVDGQSMGGAQSVSALHSQGKTEAFSYARTFGSGTHDVAISFINDAYAPGIGDRNLYVTSLDFDGTHYAAATANLFSNGIAHFTVGVPAH